MFNSDKIELFCYRYFLRPSYLRFVNTHEMRIHRKSSEGENHHYVHIVKLPAGEGLDPGPT